jgi:Holliday junction resolvase RusA-like endonuclease
VSTSVSDAKKLVIRLPLPPLTTNSAYVNVAGRGRVLIPQMIAYKATVGWLVKEAMQQPGAWPIEPPYALALWFYRQTARADVDGSHKAPVDAIFGALGVDDGLVSEIHLYKRKDAINPRLDCLLWQAKE